MLGRLKQVAKIHEKETFAGFSAADLLRFDELLDATARNLAAARNRHLDKKVGPLDGAD